MVAKLINAFFGCWHKRYSFPMTVRHGSRRNTAAALTGTYVVCLDCGKEFAYDWKEMKIVEADRDHSTGVRSLATKEAS